MHVITMARKVKGPGLSPDFGGAGHSLGEEQVKLAVLERAFGMGRVCVVSWSR